MDNNLNLPSNSSTEFLTDLVLEENIIKKHEKYNKKVDENVK